MVGDNDVDLDRILRQVLGGVVTGGVLWDLLRSGFGLRYPGGRRSGGLSFPFPFPIPMPDRREDTRGGDWRRADSRGGWSPTHESWKRSRWDRDDDDDDDDHDHGHRGGWRTGGRF